ncbi:hypothetical protein BT63DRAFT_199844 [Microthyrium microscopicum]|uniref:Uncharacterized protein n=1 Tax=Microthyrium microscopicum TaxID=703497 RepID=A0A6A6UH06_9PEZI|nr:hypothetical protein BT63DRAFT_199844 [Microthyrium microscopicum]
MQMLSVSAYEKKKIFPIMTAWCDIVGYDKHLRDLNLVHPRGSCLMSRRSVQTASPGRCWPILIWIIMYQTRLIYGGTLATTICGTFVKTYYSPLAFAILLHIWLSVNVQNQSHVYYSRTTDYVHCALSCTVMLRQHKSRTRDPPRRYPIRLYNGFSQDYLFQIDSIELYKKPIVL